MRRITQDKTILAAAGLILLAAVGVGFAFGIFPESHGQSRATQTSIFAGPPNEEAIRQLYTPGPGGEISREQAIGLAEQYCSQNFAAPRQTPVSMASAQVSWGEAMPQMVWQVDLGGAWQIDPPPLASATSAPISFAHCVVLLDVHDGTMLNLSNQPQK